MAKEKRPMIKQERTITKAGTARFVLMSLALFLSGVMCPRPLFAQSKQEIDLVKSMIALANEERPALIAMSRAKNEKDLDRILAEKPSWSKIGRIIYSTRLYQLNPEKGGVAVLQSLPKSALEMDAFDEFAFEPDSAVLRPDYRGYYAAAFRSVIKHPEFLHSIFMVAAEFYSEDWSDEDDIDWYYSELAMVHKTIPVEYDRAVMKEKPESRKWLSECGHSK